MYSTLRFCKLPGLEILRTNRVKTAHDTRVKDQEHAVGKEPGDGIGIADGGEAETAHKTEGDQGAGDQLGHARHHGLIGIAHALQAVAENEDHRKHRIKHALDDQVLLYILEDHDLAGADKQRRHAAPGAVVEYKGQRTVDHRRGRRAPDPAADAGILPRAQVLTAVGGHGDAAGLQGSGDHIVYL